MENHLNSRVYLRPPVLSDAAEFTARARSSSALHTPWVRPPATRASYARYVERMAAPGNCALLLCTREHEVIAGVFNITNTATHLATHLAKGPFCSANLGYYVFAGFERQGLMALGLQLTVQHAFKTLGLHRLEANIQPENTASLALVRACGFAQEDYSRRYLKVAGRCCDLTRWARVNPES